MCFLLMYLYTTWMLVLTQGFGFLPRRRVTGSFSFMLAPSGEPSKPMMSINLYKQVETKIEEQNKYVPLSLKQGFESAVSEIKLPRGDSLSLQL